jgi:hypothetical protein
MATTRREKPEMIDGAVPVRYTSSTTITDGSDVMPVKGSTVVASGIFTRPADTTPYTAADAVTTSTSAPAPLIIANAARVTGGSGVIIGGSFVKSTTSTTNASFRLWLFDTTPAAIPNDNAPWSPPLFAERATLIGTVTADFATGVMGSDGVRVSLTLPRGYMAFQAVGTSIVAIVQALGAYTPGSAEQFFLALDILQD